MVNSLHSSNIIIIKLPITGWIKYHSCFTDEDIEIWARNESHPRCTQAHVQACSLGSRDELLHLLGPHPSQRPESRKMLLGSRLSQAWGKCFSVSSWWFPHCTIYTSHGDVAHTVLLLPLAVGFRNLDVWLVMPTVKSFLEEWWVITYNFLQGMIAYYSLTPTKPILPGKGLLAVFNNLWACRRAITSFVPQIGHQTQGHTVIPGNRSPAYWSSLCHRKILRWHLRSHIWL